MHHERMDASGYHRSVGSTALPAAARILAAADAYVACRQARPHRPAYSAEEARRELENDVRAGRLDADAVDAVLQCSGHRVGRRRAEVAGLTAREVEVLRLVARGLSTKQIAAALHISPRTAEHHIEGIYAKTGVTTRAAATAFALQHQLVDAIQS
jgi:DNA-binding CsgD family transcriptional regulator